MPIFTCPQIKEIYDALYHNVEENYHVLAATDTLEELDALRSKIITTKKAFFELLYKSDVSDDHAIKYIETFNQDIVHVGTKDINGYWYVLLKSTIGNKYDESSVDTLANLYNPATEYITETPAAICTISDCNGYWGIVNEDDHTMKIFNPETGYLSEELDVSDAFDVNGYWPICTIEEGLFTLFNPHIRHSSEKFKTVFTGDNSGYWLVVDQNSERYFYYPLTGWQSESFTGIQENGLPDKDGNWQIIDINGAMKTYSPSKDTFIY